MVASMCIETNTTEKTINYGKIETFVSAFVKNANPSDLEAVDKYD